MPRLVKSAIDVGQTAPDFSLPDLEGGLFSLANALARGPVVAVFFKAGCPTCQFALPFFERLFKAYGGENVTLVGISQDDAKATRKFCETNGLTFPVLLDDEDGYTVSNSYGLTNVPTFYLISPPGKIQVASVGFDRKAVETIGEMLAHASRRPAVPIFLPDEIVPESKPGCSSKN